MLRKAQVMILLAYLTLSRAEVADPIAEAVIDYLFDRAAGHASLASLDQQSGLDATTVGKSGSLALQGARPRASGIPAIGQAPSSPSLRASAQRHSVASQPKGFRQDVLPSVGVFGSIAEMQSRYQTFRASATAAHAEASTAEAPQRKFRVAVIGGGPSGACAAEIFAEEPNVETFLFERKMDNCKPCGGAIPLCMVDEFKLPETIIDRKVNKMTMISPTNKEVDIGKTLKDNEYIGMTRREVFDKFLRDRAVEKGANSINALVMSIDTPATDADPYVINYNQLSGDGCNATGAAKGTPKTMEVDVVIGADGANSRVAKAIDAGDYDYAIAFQERIKLSDEQMKRYENTAEMYVGDDVSPDFYGWVFPKYDHVGVGTGTVIDKGGIKKYQEGIRKRAEPYIQGGKVIKVEAHPIPESYRPRRVSGRAALVGDAAGYVTKCSGEGIYFAAKSGRMAAQAIVKLMKEKQRLPTEAEIKETYIKDYDKAYFPTYAVLDILQKVFYSSDAGREAFVDMCESEYVQKVTFDSYLYKKVQGNNPIEDLKLGAQTIGSLIYHNINKPDVANKRELTPR
jgi:geranylgeranyl reductase